MTFEEAVELVGRWPSDRSVPKKLSDAIAASDGEEAAMMGMLVEALMVASAKPADFKLIQRYFS